MSQPVMIGLTTDHQLLQIQHSCLVFPSCGSQSMQDSSEISST